MKSRPPKPAVIKFGSDRGDGYRFRGWKWRGGRWYAEYLSPAAYAKDAATRLQWSKNASRSRAGGFSVASRMLHAAKSRAKSQGLPFDLDKEDIVIPEFCPVLGIRLDSRFGKALDDASPTLDKLVPSLGYVKGNVAVISALANRIKSNATSAQVQAVATWMTTNVPG